MHSSTQSPFCFVFLIEKSWERASQAHLICAFTPGYLSKEICTLEDLTLHLSLIMPSPTGPNLFILLLYIFKTKGYLLFFQDYIPLSLSPGKM